jgi:hypothetical protein
MITFYIDGLIYIMGMKILLDFGIELSAIGSFNPEGITRK